MGSLPQILNIKDSHGLIQQTERWDNVLDKWQQAILEKKEVIVMADDNMDFDNENYNNRYRIKAIKEKTTQFITDNNITVHNKEPTYFVNQTPTSCIDHIYSNCPQKITHITTENNGLSDHATITATYHTKAPINTPKIIFTRPKYLLTEHNLNEYLNNNDIIQTAYNYTDPELIAEIIMREFNNIIEIIALRTKRQVKKNYTPYLNKETREGKKKLYQMHNKAKERQDNDDWREYKNYRAAINKQIDRQKQEYINKKLNNSEDRWKFLNEINNKSTFTSPRSIIHKDSIITNIQEICKIANDYYISSIKQLRDNIPQTNVTPIDILKKIYQRSQETLEIPIPTVQKITEIMRKAKSKNSVGHDNISMKMIKKTTKIMAPLITHLIKQIILEQKFPEVFKLDRITPKKKWEKPIYEIGSYRPLNNLCTIEKIIEEYFIT